MKLLLLLFFLSLTLSFEMFSKKRQFLSTVNKIPSNSYPVRFVYIDSIAYWYGEKIAIGLGVPGYAEPHIYNYIALAFWGCSVVQDVAGIWANAPTYFGTETPFGKTKNEIQTFLKKKYNAAGIKIMVSAFGATEFPTSAGSNPVQCAMKLGQFVLENNLDGADLDWEDNEAMVKGTGEQWLIKFTETLREKLPQHIITHAPQAPYFKKEYYENGGYVTVHKSVGKLINFYNVQFYNQMDSRYDSYEELFLNATGSDFNKTSVKEIMARGVPSKMLVVGKPVKVSDASNTGWIPMLDLGSYATKAYDEFKWYAGIMFWQYRSDNNGSEILIAAGHLKELCAENKNCK